MFSSVPLSIPRIFNWSSRNTTASEQCAGICVRVAPVPQHDLELGEEKSARTLKHLVKLNHANHSILYHKLQYHNHVPHIISSAYLLSASSEQLEKIYESEASSLEPWPDSPHEVSTYDWKEFQGQKEYARAFVDFFEDQLPLLGYDWKKLVEQYLFQDPKALFNNLIAGLGHPLIHLAYAYEVQSREIAMEALALAATCYNFMHVYIDATIPAQTRPHSSTINASLKSSLPGTASCGDSTLTILQRVHEDTRFDDFGSGNGLEALFQSHESAILEHWKSWLLDIDPTSQFEESQFTAVALLIGCVNAKQGRKYDFFIVHLLTTSHAVRILLPLIPVKYHLRLIRQWWLLVLAIYINQGRPMIDISRLTSCDSSTRDWPWALEQARQGKWSMDAHFVKAIRAMHVASQTWQDKARGEQYLQAAITLCTEFTGWGGFQ